MFSMFLFLNLEPLIFFDLVLCIMKLPHRGKYSPHHPVTTPLDFQSRPPAARGSLDGSAFKHWRPCFSGFLGRCGFRNDYGVFLCL